MATEATTTYDRGRWIISLMWAFVRRDAQIEVSYKFQFLSSFATVLFSTATFYFISRLVDGRGQAAELGRYRESYFGFALIGLAISRYLAAALTEASNAVRQAINQGTLEIMFASPAPPLTILGSSLLWPLCFETVRLAFCLGMASLFFDLSLHINWPVVLVSLGLSVVTFTVIGIISASLLIYFKRGDPVNWLFLSIASLVSGTVFPVNLLPDWLQALSWLVPLTHSLDALRAGFLLEQTVSQVWPSLIALLVFSVVVFPVAAVVSRLVLWHARQNGTLGNY